jgi:dephospho-CoA kinase
MFILLVGPKGCGKSHIGRVLERHLGVRFFHVEPLWMAYLSECREAGRLPVITEGIALVHPEIRGALAEHGTMSVETTGASQEILDGLMALRPREKMVVAKISAPVDVCLQRAEARDPTQQIQMDPDTIRTVNAMSDAAWVDADLQLKNEDLSDEAIVAAFRPYL